MALEFGVAILWPTLGPVTLALLPALPSDSQTLGLVQPLPCLCIETCLVSPCQAAATWVPCLIGGQCGYYMSQTVVVPKNPHN